MKRPRMVKIAANNKKSLHFGAWLSNVALIFISLFSLVSVSASETSATIQLKLLHTIKAPYVINRLAWHPDNKKLAGGQVLNKKVIVWNTDTSQVIRVIDKEVGGVGALAFSPDGKYLTVGRNFVQVGKANVHAYNAQNGQLMQSFIPPRTTRGTFNGHADNGVNAIVFSPNNQNLATHGYGGGAVGVVYDLPSGTLVATLDPSTSKFDTVRSLAWSPDGHRLALGRRNRLELWNVTSWKLEKQNDFSRQKLSALAFSPDGTRLAFGSFKVTAEQAAIAIKDIAKLPENFRRNQPVPTAVPHDLYLLDATSLSIVGTLASSHNGNSIQELIFTPDGKFLISGANARSIAVHDVSSGKEVVFLNDFKQAAHPALSHDGKYLAVGAGEEIRIYEFTR